MPVKGNLLPEASSILMMHPPGGSPLLRTATAGLRPRRWAQDFQGKGVYRVRGPW